MQDLNDLYYFVQVVDHAGFAPAGRALGIPKSKLSRRIAQLEKRLAARLIQRSTRHFSVTETGQTYYQHCKAMLVEAQAAQEAIDRTRAEPCGVIRVTCPVALLNARVGPMLTSFLTENPRVEMHLEATNRRVDLINEGVDIAIRVRPPPLDDSELVMRHLTDRGQCLVASPGLTKRYGKPALPTDLHRLPSLHLGIPQQAATWKLVGPDGAEVTIPHHPRFITRDMFMLRNAATAGIGVAQFPVFMVSELLDSGDLYRLLPDWAPRREIVHAVYASRRGLLPAVRALLDHLETRFKALNED